MSFFGERERRILEVMKRECRILTMRPLYIFCMVIAPLFCNVFFTTLMKDGLPHDLPVGVVDLDNSSYSRRVARNLDAFAQTHVVATYASVKEAREAVQRGETYGFFYIPESFAADAQAFRQPRISFYSNYSYLIAGSLLFRDMKTMSELASGAATRSVLLAKGASERAAMAYLQPIVIESHAVNNPWLNYSIYLSNLLLPGVLALLIMMVTVAAIGMEIKYDSVMEWLAMSGDSIAVALVGKLLPHTLIFTLMGVLYNVYLYGYLGFPCHSGILPMLVATLCLVLASQSLGVLMIGVLPTLRLGLSFASLWGVISLSMAGFSFPVMAMPSAVQAASILFPLRHYYLIYVAQALNGYSMLYAWENYVGLLLFMLLPFLVGHRLHRVLRHAKYIP